jgi:murein tripeptide amidase MpaA
MRKIQISSAFDSGNIKVLSLEDHSNIRLEIRPDNSSDYFQWFHFRVTGAKGLSLKIVLANASKAAFPDGWLNYNACVSVDRKVWTRIEETSYYDGELIIEHTPLSDCVYFSYFEPYTLDRHHDVVTEAVTHNGVKLSSLGETAQGRPMDCLSVGNGKKNIWLIARQHPGETMAEWWMEGFITRLLKL